MEGLWNVINLSSTPFFWLFRVIIDWGISGFWFLCFSSMNFYHSSSCHHIVVVKDKTVAFQQQQQQILCFPAMKSVFFGGENCYTFWKKSYRYVNSRKNFLCNVIVAISLKRLRLWTFHIRHYIGEFEELYEKSWYLFFGLFE